MRCVGAALLTLACLRAEQAHAGDIPALEFSIKPRLCVLTNGEEACYDELEMRWSAANTLNLCLYQNQQSEPLKCWTDTSSGTFRYVLSASSNVTFHLRQPGEKWLVSEAFEVIHDDKRHRRARRNPWSFF